MDGLVLEWAVVESVTAEVGERGWESGPNLRFQLPLHHPQIFRLRLRNEAPNTFLAFRIDSAMVGAEEAADAVLAPAAVAAVHLFHRPGWEPPAARLRTARFKPDSDERSLASLAAAVDAAHWTDLALQILPADVGPKRECRSGGSLRQLCEDSLVCRSWTRSLHTLPASSPGLPLAEVETFVLTTHRYRLPALLPLSALSRPLTFVLDEDSAHAACETPRIRLPDPDLAAAAARSVSKSDTRIPSPCNNAIPASSHSVASASNDDHTSSTTNDA